MARMPLGFYGERVRCRFARFTGQVAHSTNVSPGTSGYDTAVVTSFLLYNQRVRRCNTLFIVLLLYKSTPKANVYLIANLTHIHYTYLIDRKNRFTEYTHQSTYGGSL